MVYAGAEGDTCLEMMKVLHYPTNDTELHNSFARLRVALGAVVQKSLKETEQSKKRGEENDPVTLIVANRLFGQKGYKFRQPFLRWVENIYGATFQQLDFDKDSSGATKRINEWVENQTQQRIRNPIPEGALIDLTRLVVVNAIYLKAPWAHEFEESGTTLRPFHAAGGEPVTVPTMTTEHHLGYSKRDGFSTVAIPYRGGDIQFLILLPEKVNGLAELETKLTASLLRECANLAEQEVILRLPKFKLEPSVLPLSKKLQGLGMRSAFDQPKGSANFDRIAPRRPNEYLWISEVFHKAFLKVDEKGTEAAAAASSFAALGIPPRPVEVKVDHPFLFAVQHRQSGACLFLGQVVDPR